MTIYIKKNILNDNNILVYIKLKNNLNNKLIFVLI